MAEIRAEFEAVVDELLFQDGATVTAGQPVMVLTIMKMLTTIEAPCAGIIAYNVAVGDYIQHGHLLCSVVGCS